MRKRINDNDNVLLDLHNSSHPTQPHSVIVLLFIQNISKFLTSLPSPRTSLTGVFPARFQNMNLTDVFLCRISTKS